MVRIRSPNKEIVEDIVRQQANDLNGLLNLPSERNVIQEEYKERVNGFSTDAQQVSHSQLRDILDEFVEDRKRDIEHVNDEVYFVSPFNDPEAEKRIQKRIVEIYHTDFVFTGDRLRNKFNVPMNNSEFFFERLQQKGLIKPIRDSPSVFTIGDELRKKRGEPNLEEQLQDEASNGTIENADFEEIIEAPAVDEIIAIFEKEKEYIVDLNGEFLVKSALDDYIDHVARQVEPEIETEFEQANDILLLTDYESKVKRQIREETDILSQVPEDIRTEIVTGVREKLKEGGMLDLTIEPANGNQTVVVTPSFEEKISNQAEEIYSQIESQQYRQAQRFYDEIDEHVDDLSIPGGPVVNEYFRTAVRRESRSLVDARLFNVDRDAE